MDAQMHIFVLLISAVITPVVLGFVLSRVKNEKIRMVLLVCSRCNGTCSI